MLVQIEPLQLALEQHRFELPGSNFTGFCFFFFSQYKYLQYYTIHSWLNLQIQKHGYGELTASLGSSVSKDSAPNAGDRV